MRHLSGIFWMAMVKANPVFVLALGLCSTLAVTLRVENAAFMTLVVTAAAVFSSVLVSLLRYKIPHRFRFVSYMLIISTAVIGAEQVLRTFAPGVARSLGPYVGLIVTNCLVLGRLESYASIHKPPEAMADALGVGAGYGLVLVAMSVLRELLGNGTLWGLQIMPDQYVANRIFSSPPGAFLIFAALLFVVNWIRAQAGRSK